LSSISHLLPPSRGGLGLGTKNVGWIFASSICRVEILAQVSSWWHFFVLTMHGDFLKRILAGKHSQQLVNTLLFHEWVFYILNLIKLFQIQIWYTMRLHNQTVYPWYVNLGLWNQINLKKILNNWNNIKRDFKWSQTSLKCWTLKANLAVYQKSPVSILFNVKSFEFSVIEDWSRDWSAGNKTTSKMEMHFVLQI